MSAPQNPLFVAFQFFRGCYCFRIPQHQNLHIRADWRLGIYGNPSGCAVSPKSLWCLKSDAISVFWSFTNDCRLLISNNCNDLSVYQHLLWCCCLQRRSLKLLILTKNSRIGYEGTLSKNWSRSLSKNKMAEWCLSLRLESRRNLQRNFRRKCSKTYKKKISHSQFSNLLSLVIGVLFIIPQRQLIRSVACVAG